MKPARFWGRSGEGPPLILLAVLPLLIGAGVFIIMLNGFSRYRDQLCEGMKNTSQLHGRLVAEQIRGRLSSLDLLLLMLENRSLRYNLSEEENSRQFYRYLKNRALLLTPVNRIFMLDSEGRMKFTTDTRPPCEECRLLYEGLMFSHVDQLLSFAVMPWVREKESYLVMSRRIDNPDGSMAGILAAEISETLLFDDIEYSDSMILSNAVLFNEEALVFAAIRADGVEGEREGLYSCLGITREDLDESGVSGMVGGIATVFSGDHLTTLIQIKDFSFQLGLRYDMSPQLEIWRHRRLAGLSVVVIGTWIILLFTIAVIRLIGEKQKVRAEMMDNLERMVEERTAELNTALLRIERLVSYDPLTDAMNRRGMLKLLEQNYARIKRYGGSFTLVMCDIDHFKKINDTFGHEEGDRALCYAVGLLKERLRKSDQISRWGGEEFLIYYPELEHDQALMLTEKLRKAFEEHPWREDNVMTCSFGVASLKGDEDLESLIRRADSAMYRAKKKRNSVSE